MNVKYITCSDPREFNDVHDIVQLGQMSSRVEIAIQAHPSKMSFGMPRNEWTQELIKCAQQERFAQIHGMRSPDINIAIHINNEWCADLCKTGRFPAELHQILSQRYRYGFHNNPVISRIQLNVPKYVIPDANIFHMMCMIDANRDYKFIIQYNDSTRDLVYALHEFNVNFSPLYDASGGRGKLPNTWRAPVFNSGLQGYSGGLSPENVSEILDKINSVVPANREVWIDAEGKLKTDDKFDINRARQYVLNAESWLKRQKQK